MIGRSAPSRVHRPSTLADLTYALLNDPAAEVVGGGTLALPRWGGHGAPESVVHLPSVLELRRRSRDAGHVTLGACVTLTEIARAPGLPNALRSAAATIGGPALRAAATIGGNVTAARPGCLAAVLLTLDASAHVIGRYPMTAPRHVPVETVLGGADLVVLSVRWQGAVGDRTAFARTAVRAAGGPNTASVAVRLGRGHCGIAVGSTGSVPHRLPHAEAVWRDHHCARRTAAAAADEAVVLPGRAAGEDYRRAAVKVLTRRLLTELEEEESA
ncbi:FAD binding domain-containing protein [Actinomadura rugatobispora]|uniref:FAD binding domain-containing protein n=1 Tax=Actinomadura rugatobispora TaxID=1994 RepID=A0ABW1A028_9ACTN|nr:FAD binding domain-containing protein [Actinomadura rugatobispora]